MISAQQTVVCCRSRPNSAGTVTYAYDAANRLSSVTDWDSNVISYAYDDADRMLRTAVSLFVIYVTALAVPIAFWAKSRHELMTWTVTILSIVATGVLVATTLSLSSDVGGGRTVSVALLSAATVAIPLVVVARSFVRSRQSIGEVDEPSRRGW